MRVPELPEVETIVQGLRPKLIGRQVIAVSVINDKVLHNVELLVFQNELVERTFCNVSRRGKYLMFGFTPGGCMVVHLRMTGQMVVCKADRVHEKHLSFFFDLSDGNQLRLIDQRKFGTVYWIPPGCRAKDAQTGGFTTLGCEPLGKSFSLEGFKELLAGRSTRIKPFLLDQRHIAGLGNIYTDEILHRARIHPERAVCDLTEQDMQVLYQSIRQVLKEGIYYRGTSISDYVDAVGRQGGYQEHLQVYGRNQKPCPTCGTTICRIKVGGRGTYFCPQCQPEKG